MINITTKNGSYNFTTCIKHLGAKKYRQKYVLFDLILYVLLK